MCLLPAQADADALVENVLTEIWSERPHSAPGQMTNVLKTQIGEGSQQCESFKRMTRH